MADFKAKKFNLSDINGGQHYENGQVLSAETINKVVEAAAYGQEAREKADEAFNKSTTAETNASEAKEIAEELQGNVYDKTQVDDLVASSQADLNAAITAVGEKIPTKTETLTFEIEEDGTTKTVTMQVLVGSVTQNG